MNQRDILQALSMIKTLRVPRLASDLEGKEVIPVVAEQ